MQLAATLLRDGVLRAQEIAARVGYASEAAFNRTFKRYAGQPPRAFRRRSAGSGRGAALDRIEISASPAARRPKRRHVAVVDT